MSINELRNYLLFLGLLVAFTYEKSRASGAFFFTLLSFLGLSFRHTPSNFPNYNVFTNSNANAPLLYQISGTWSNHEGSILPRCRIPSLYGFPFRDRVQPRSHYVSERGGRRETAFCSTLLSSFVKNSILSLSRYDNQSGAAPHTPFVPLLEGPYQTLREEKNSRGVLASLYFALLDYLLNLLIIIGGRGRKMSFASGARRSRNKGSREASRSITTKSRYGFHRRSNPSSHFFRYAKEDRASPIDEQWIDNFGIAFFFPLFLLASSNPFVRNSFVCTESLAESNPVLQDPILAIHPPCIFAGAVASAMGFGLCINKMMNKMMNGIVALYSPMQKERRTLPSSSGCVGARVTRELFTLTDKCHPCLRQLLRSNRSLLMLLRRRFFARLLRPLRALMDTGREQAKRVVRNERKDTTTLPLCSAGANTAVSDPKKDREQIRIWISTCWWFFTVGILLGSWWAHHESGRGGRWFRDPVENASLMPWVLATACIHSVIIPKAYFLTLFLNIVTFLCCVLGTYSVRSGLLAPVHSPATDYTRGITLLWRFFLIITSISMILLSQMKQRTLARPSKKILLWSVIVLVIAL
uniref:Cytochrome c biogenesis FN n=1 Tax=Gnetum gnemon TaxID=3382 RepID=A0A0N7AKD4_GNEGN|nr:cytochrome c biogenesis FN [Gnetum gnemon]QJH91904.1 cytochrome c maturation subunit FN [Gnetum gnemon]